MYMEMWFQIQMKWEKNALGFYMDLFGEWYCDIRYIDELHKDLLKAVKKLSTGDTYDLYFWFLINQQHELPNSWKGVVLSL